jgi:transcriptional antiterminator RfaH
MYMTNAGPLEREILPPQLDGARWYAVQCLSHRENAACYHLQNQDFEVFLPRREKTRRHARKLETVLAPFFPSYLFVRLNPARDRWRSINGTHGVARIVMHGDRPAPAPVGVVEALRTACDPRGVVTDFFDLKEGQPVRILAGAFADLIGHLDRLDDTRRVRVLLDIMGGRVPIVVPRTSVVPANDIP